MEMPFTIRFNATNVFIFEGAKAIPNAAYGPGSTNQPILLDDVKCSGIESRLIDCLHGGLETNNCGHSQDAGVVCITGMSPWYHYRVANIFF